MCTSTGGTERVIYAWLLRRWPQVLGLGIALLVLGWAAHWIYQRGGDVARADCAEDRAEALQAAMDDLTQAEAERDRLAQELADELNRPNAAPVIREVVRANPSNCDLPRPVADSLREQIARANESAR